MTIDEYMKENADNLNMEVLCEKFNVSIPTVYRHLKMNGLKIKKMKNLDRNNEMINMRNEGLTYQEIANKFGISRQRVEQIFHDYS